LRCVVGLGNPGKKFFSTRHNIGFEIVDKFADKNKLIFKPSKHDYYFSEGLIDSSDFFLLKPTTYMNASGIAVTDFLTEHHIELNDLLIIVDDVNLPIGQVRLRHSGSDGGHNGIKSIIYHLQNDTFPRLRFGIGADFQKGEMADFVLSKFDEKDTEAIEKSVDFSCDLIRNFIKDGYKSMLDHFSKETKLNSNSEKDTENDSSKRNYDIEI
jgi:PTH1 family peptidyl-tRNA hydrolase